MTSVRLEAASSTGGKFWEAAVQGRSLVLRWGKTGTPGQTKTKEFASKETAEAEAQKLARSKLKKGYIEVGRATAKKATAKKATAKKATAKKATAKKATAKKASTKKATAKKAATKKAATKKAATKKAATKKAATKKATAKKASAKKASTKKATAKKASAKKATAKKATAKKASAKKASAKKAATEQTKLRLPEGPSPFGRKKRHRSFQTFTKEDMDLFHMGFPNLVFLDDSHAHNRTPKQIIRWTKAAADGVDPVYRTVWPTDVALAYAHVFPTAHREDPVRFNQRLARYQANPIPTEETARILLREFMPGDEVYSGWRAPPALYTLEHYLGAESLALVIVECLADLKKSDVADEDEYHHVRIVLEVLGTLMLRMSTASRKRVQQAIDTVIAKRKPVDILTRHLRFLPDHPLKGKDAKSAWFMSELSVTSEQRWSGVEKYGPSYVEPRALYLDGAEPLLEADLRLWLSGLSKRSILRFLDTFGRIQHPAVVRLVLSLGKFKAMANEIHAWRHAHRDYVEEVLPQFANDPYVEKGLAILDGKKKSAKKAKDPMAATSKLLAQLEKKLPKAFPDQERVTALVREALTAAREIALLDGQGYLECYFSALWAEFPFELEVSDENYKLLYNAYEETIFGED